MKKIYLLGTVLLVTMIISAGVCNARVEATDSDETQSVTVDSSNDNGNSDSDTQNQNRVETETENRENNPETGTMAEAEQEARVESALEESDSEYEPESESAKSRLSKVSTAAEELIRASVQIANTGIGDQIRTIAQTQVENQDKINTGIDKAESRTSFAKFFIGPNYTQLKNIQQLMEQNRLQIRVLEQLRTQLQNEGEETDIQSQITVLQEQNTALQNELDQLDDGFSLFGWISRWLARYSN